MSELSSITTELYEQGAQVGVTAPADVIQARLAAGRILPRHQAQPSSQMPAVAELSGVADGRNDGRVWVTKIRCLTIRAG